MNGAPDPIYLQARKVLLDALDALLPHRDALILVGAQAIYLHTGEAAVEIAPYTTDADVVINPQALGPEPLLETALHAAGFVTSVDPAEIGRWTPVALLHPQVRIDLMVPEALAGEGRRAARLGPHGNRIARRARGLEAALVDNARHTISAFEPEDLRRHKIAVAGPGALLVAKLHKLRDRTDQPSRIEDKDALDVLRLLRAIETEVMVVHMITLGRNELAAEVTEEARGFLRDLFGRVDAYGTRMAVRALQGVEDPNVVAQSCVTLANDLLTALRAG